MKLIQWLISKISGQTYLPVQFQITNRCNLKCRHCFHEKDYAGQPRALTMEQWKTVWRDYRELLKRLSLKPSIAVGGGEPWRGEVAVTNTLGPDETGAFSHSFASPAPEGRAHPDIRASVIWMRIETTRQPDWSRNQNWGGGPSDPGSLPLQRGGVTGADVRPTPVE